MSGFDHHRDEQIREKRMLFGLIGSTFIVKYFGVSLITLGTLITIGTSVSVILLVKEHQRRQTSIYSQLQKLELSHEKLKVVIEEMDDEQKKLIMALFGDITLIMREGEARIARNDLREHGSNPGGNQSSSESSPYRAVRSAPLTQEKQEPMASAATQGMGSGPCLMYLVLGLVFVPIPRAWSLFAVAVMMTITKMGHTYAQEIDPLHKYFDDASQPGGEPKEDSRPEAEPKEFESRGDPKISDHWVFRPKPRHPPMSDTIKTLKSIPSTPLQQVLEQGQGNKVSLDSSVNLGLGAAKVIDGFMINQPEPVWFGFGVELLAPQWLPVDLRHELTPQACTEMADPVLRVHCENLLNPGIARQKCPQTEAVEVITNNLLGEIRDMYKDALNPAIDVQLLRGICDKYKGLCPEVVSEPNVRPRRDLNGTRGNSTFQEGRSPRRKRLAFALLGIGTLLAGLFSMGSLAKILSLNDQVQRLGPRLETLRDGIEMHMGNTQNLTLMTAEGFDHVYDLIETVRCANLKGAEDLELILMAQSYRNYLHNIMEAIMDMAHTGRISPLLFGADKLRQLINKDHVLRNSLLAHEPHLFYSFARGYPVRLDFEGFRFSFIVEIPVPKLTDVYIRYKIDNVGFHGSNEKQIPEQIQALKDTSSLKVLVHRARLPQMVVLRPHGVLAPYRPALCQHSGPISMCPKQAMLPIAYFPCLPLLMVEDCTTHCEEHKDCAGQIAISLEPGNPEIANTRAGVLIRAPFGGVSAHYHELSALETSKKVEISASRTAFVTNATQIRIRDHSVVPALTPMVYAKIFDTALVNLSMYLPLPTDAKAWHNLYTSMLENQDQVARLKGEFISKSPLASFFSMIGTTFGSLSIVLIIFLVIVCCCMTQGRCKALNPVVRMNPFLPPRPGGNVPQNDYILRTEVDLIWRQFDRREFRRFVMGLAEFDGGGTSLMVKIA